MHAAGMRRRARRQWAAVGEPGKPMVSAGTPQPWHPRTMDRLLEATYRVEQSHFWWHGLRSFVRPIIADATAGVPRARILDCGCGTGANLVLLDDFGRAFGF